MLLKGAHFGVDSALTTISNKRIVLRNRFKFDQTNVLWNAQVWKTLFKDMSFNIHIIINESVNFALVLGAYFLSLLSFVIVRRKANKRLRNKPILKRGFIKSVDIFQLTYSALIYPVIALSIYFVFKGLSLVGGESLYTVSVALEVITIYAFFVFLLEGFIEQTISRLIKFSLIITYSLFGFTMYLFKAHLFRFSYFAKELIMPINDSIISCFMIMVVMLIPTFIIFKYLGKYICLKNKSSKVIVQTVRYFTLYSLIISIVMMILGGYPNIGMRSTFDLYQSVFWGCMFISGTS